MNELIQELITERFKTVPTSPPVPPREPDNIRTWARRQLVLAEMPDDEWAGEEAA